MMWYNYDWQYPISPLDNGIVCSIRWINWNQKLKLKTKTKFFCCVNENSTTFLGTLNTGDKKTEGEKSVKQSRNVNNKKKGF